jgi:hypothetical protein
MGQQYQIPDLFEHWSLLAGALADSGGVDRRVVALEAATGSSPLVQ